MANNPQLKRAFWHNYKGAARYHITLSKSREAAAFSIIAGDWKLPVNTPGSSYTKWSPLGKIIADQIFQLSEIHPALRADQYVVMPDHVHILLWVKEALPEHIGFYIARFKNIVNQKANIEHVFEDGYNDRIVTATRNLNAIFSYIRSNPYRLAVRKANPDFFQRVNNITLSETRCQAYGNIHLLENPFKEQVVVHRSDTLPQHTRNKARWSYMAANGGILVSPFISKAEKEVRAEAEGVGGKVILIIPQEFGERYKPAAHDFALCCQGRLLIISLGLPAATPLSRELCQRMNSLAAEIAASNNN